LDCRNDPCATGVHGSFKARSRLREIHAYIAKDSPPCATQMVERLIRRGEGLAAGTQGARRVPEYPQDDLHEVLEPSL
jgi:hypothetical protein